MNGGKWGGRKESARITMHKEEQALKLDMKEQMTATPKPKTSMEAAWEVYKEANPPKGQAQLYYKDNTEYWNDGFRTALRSPEIAAMRDALNTIIDALGIDDFTYEELLSEANEALAQLDALIEETK